MSQGFCISYLNGPEPAKLLELRARTDRQLLSIIHSKLELGLQSVALAEQTYTDENTDHAEPLLGRAEQAVIEVKQLLPVLTEDQHRNFGRQLKDLQEALSRQGRDREGRSATASKASF
jgi:hypothetical protein